MKILVVDDEASNREIAEVILRTTGYEVRSCHSARSAFELLEVEAVDAILMDMSMPEIDGVEAVRRLRSREQTCGIPIIGVSARASRPEIDEAIAAGCDTYLTKPYRRKELLKAIEQALATRR